MSDAALNREALAKANASWVASFNDAVLTKSLNKHADIIEQLENADESLRKVLVQTGMITSHDEITDVNREGSTVVINVACEIINEVLELDALGNVVRGVE